MHWFSYMKHGLSIVGEGLQSLLLFTALVTFLDTEYMTRVWTVQEFAVAKELILLYGRVAILGNTVFKMVQNVGNHATSCCSFRTHCLTGTDAYWDMLSELNKWSARWKKPMIIGQDCQEWPLMVLERFRYRLASDPRDKVYSLLGLANPKW